MRKWILTCHRTKFKQPKAVHRSLIVVAWHAPLSRLLSFITTLHHSSHSTSCFYQHHSHIHPCVISCVTTQGETNTTQASTYVCPPLCQHLPYIISTSSITMHTMSNHPDVSLSSMNKYILSSTHQLIIHHNKEAYNHNDHILYAHDYLGFLLYLLKCGLITSSCTYPTLM